MVDKLFTAPAFANQPDHHNVGFGLAGDHPQQHAFPDAAARHQPDTLAFADGQQAVNRFHAHV
ncbi:hypothetical protein ECZU29_04840 [Escherichia coli]|nr:hypothetical protein ECZU29_04840 [Escherichia coli]